MVECQILFRSLRDPQATPNPLIKMEPWAYGNHGDLIDDDTEDPDVAALREIDNEIEKIAVRCGGGKKKGKKGKHGK